MRCSENRQRLQAALANRRAQFSSTWGYARPHASQPTLQTLNKLGYQVLPHLPYSSDLSLTDCHFFERPNKALQGKCFHNQQEAENAFQEFSKSGSMDLYATGTNFFLTGKNVWIPMVPSLVNKDAFEPSYSHLKLNPKLRLLLYQPNRTYIYIYT